MGGSGVGGVGRAMGGGSGGVGVGRAIGAIGAIGAMTGIGPVVLSGTLLGLSSSFGPDRNARAASAERTNARMC